MPDEKLNIEVLPVAGDETRVISLQGALTLSTFFPFQSAVRIETAKTLIIDMSGVTYCDSAGLGALVNAYVSFEKNGRRFLLAGVTPRVKDLFTITRVNQLFKDFPTWQDALMSGNPTARA